MTPPRWLTQSQRAAFRRGAARALADCANTEPRTTIDVSIDIGGGQRRHIDWCLTCQTPAARCACGHDTGDVLVDIDPADTDADIATLLAHSRAQLQLHADNAPVIETVHVGGARL